MDRGAGTGWFDNTLAGTTVPADQAPRKLRDDMVKLARRLVRGIGMPKDPVFILESAFPGGVLVNKEDVIAAVIAAALLPTGLLVLTLSAPALAGGVAFAILFGLGSGLTSIVSGALPLQLLGRERYGARLGWLVAGVQALDKVRVRKSGLSHLVDIQVRVDGELSDERCQPLLALAQDLVARLQQQAAQGRMAHVGTVPAGLNQVVEVAAGGDFWAEDSSHSLALKSDGMVVGWGYDASLLADKRDLTRRDLDARFPDRPVLVLIDPPFERGDEYPRVIEAIGDSARTGAWVTPQTG
mgnify:CR=1 FL=1